MPYYRTLLCDAAYDHRVPGFAAIAVCEGAGQQRGTLLLGDVVPAAGSHEAEVMAVLRACALLAGGRETGAHVFTDAEQVAKEAARPRGPLALDLSAALRAREATLRHVDRGTVKPAHNAAGRLLAAWRAGRSGEPTFTPRPYLSRKRGPAAV